jgi:pilus assembly protein Flp/PilA
MLTKFLQDTKGATAIEYALIASMLSVIILIGLGVMQTNLGDLFITISNSVSGALGGQ